MKRPPPGCVKEGCAVESEQVRRTVVVVHECVAVLESPAPIIVVRVEPEHMLDRFHVLLLLSVRVGHELQ